MYGLLGKSLGHSLSKTIHETLTPSMDYHLYETSDLKNFFRARPFKAVNVTHPYKEACMPFLDGLDETAEEAGVVNTIIDEKGKLIGYNTDVLALKQLIRDYFPANRDTVVAVIGNGATSKSIKKALTSLGYAAPHIFARHPKTNEKRLETIEEHPSIEVLIQATPVGMYPDNDQRFGFSLEAFPDLKLVFDLIYNPLRTHLLLDAKRLGIKGINGLEMLVEQARESQKRFFKDHAPMPKDKLLEILRKKVTNLVLIGLPFSGKSHFGRLLKERLDKPLIDVDQAVEDSENAPIHAIFQKKGESYFRALEEAKVKEAAKRYGQVIVPGGGIVLSKAAMESLRQNSIIIFLDLSLDLIDETMMRGRPLAESLDDLKKLKAKRQPLYEKYADFIISKDTWDEETIIARIEEALDEYFNSKRSQS
ncbi:MAG: shikimate kinase [Bacillota bacterium]